MRSEDVYILLPAFNEGSAIGEVVAGLLPRFPRVVVVDDGSLDDTAERALAAGAVVLRHPLNRGQGAALQTAIEYALAAGAACLVTFDSDGQHRPEDLPRLLEPIAAGRADVVLGSRFLGDPGAIPRGRRWLLRAAVLFTRWTSGTRLTDTHNGLRAFSRRAAERVDIRLDRMAHASELIDQIRRSGLGWEEVPVTVRYTDYSRRKGQRAGHAVRIVLDYLLGRVFH